jgi:hypothetical protein
MGRKYAPSVTICWAGYDDDDDEAEGRICWFWFNNDDDALKEVVSAISDSTAAVDELELEGLVAVSHPVRRLRLGGLLLHSCSAALLLVLLLSFISALEDTAESGLLIFDDSIRYLRNHFFFIFLFFYIYIFSPSVLCISVLYSKFSMSTAWFWGYIYRVIIKEYFFLFGI